MRFTRGERSRYNPVSSSPSADEQEQDGTVNGNQELATSPSAGGSNSNSSSNVRRQNVLMQLVSKEDTPLRDSIAKTLDADADHAEGEDDAEEVPAEDAIRVVILDAAQKKFPIAHVNPDWTIGKFKRFGAKIHKVRPSQQRLIFRGKMLADDGTKTLRDYGIHTQDDLIVHLFPKPRVVVTSESNVSGDSMSHGGRGGGSSSNNNNGGGDGGGGGGAHIPSIIIDPDEQQRRGQILVLGSVEIAESQNNVKMLSLLLLVICFMRLLALFSVAMGAAEEPVNNNGSYEDDLVPHDGNRNSTDHHGGSSGDHYDPNAPSQMEPRTWHNSDYFDLIVSVIGFYVATLGMKATQENTLRLANAYLIGTIVAGIGWNAWNVFMYVLFYREETQPSDDDDLPPLTRDDFVTVAFFTVAMPLMVWGLCCARAYEFRRLIEEAETEAAERIRSQLSMHEQGHENDGVMRNTAASRSGSTAGQELEDLSSNSTRQPTEIV